MQTDKQVVVFLPGVQFSVLEAIASFMYHGEVAVSQSLLPFFLRTAAELGIKGWWLWMFLFVVRIWFDFLFLLHRCAGRWGFGSYRYSPAGCCE